MRPHTTLVSLLGCEIVDVKFEVDVLGYPPSQRLSVVWRGLHTDSLVPVGIERGVLAVVFEHVPSRTPTPRK